jgi:hypothetical protein
MEPPGGPTSFGRSLNGQGQPKKAPILPDVPLNVRLRLSLRSIWGPGRPCPLPMSAAICALPNSMREEIVPLGALGRVRKARVVCPVKVT